MHLACPSLHCSTTLISAIFCSQWNDGVILELFTSGKHVLVRVNAEFLTFNKAHPLGMWSSILRCWSSIDCTLDPVIFTRTYLSQSDRLANVLLWKVILRAIHSCQAHHHLLLLESSQTIVIVKVSTTATLHHIVRLSFTSEVVRITSNHVCEILISLDFLILS
jgi:hypothetical protein